MSTQFIVYYYTSTGPFLSLRGVQTKLKIKDKKSKLQLKKQKWFTLFNLCSVILPFDF